MDYEKLAKVFDRAVAANWLDRHRTGRMVELPAEGDFMVTGDIHGSMRNFAALVRTAALDENPRRHLLLQEVTHQLEMGEDRSYLVLEKTAALKAKYPHRVHVLLGNHELAEIQGREIFKGGLCLNLLFENAIEKAYGGRAAAVREKYLEFMKTMPLAVSTAAGVFASHSTPDRQEAERYSLDFFRQTPGPDDFRKGGRVEKLVWGRDYDQATADLLAGRLGCEIFLVGHAPCSRGYEVPNTRHIILDSKDKYAAYLIFDLAGRPAHRDLVERVRHVHPEIEKKVSAGS